MEHSAKLNMVKHYYTRGLWDHSRVLAAAGRWITAAEAEEILCYSRP